MNPLITAIIVVGSIILSISVGYIIAYKSIYQEFNTKYECKESIIVNNKPRCKSYTLFTK